MPDEVVAFPRREEAERERDELDDVVEAPRSRGAQEGLQLGKREFDRVQVRAVRRQEAQARADAVNGGVHLRLLVDGEIVEDHHVARPEGGHEHLLDIGEKGGIVERAIEYRRRVQAIHPESGNDRVRLPVATRRVVAQSRAPRTAAIPPEEIGGDARLIEEDIAARVVERLRVAPVAPGRGDIRAALLVGVYRFF
jgi:hypothetical protein